MSENEVTITVRPNGPFRVEGPCKLLDADGKEWDLTGKPAFSLCRCGGSTKKPFCDGTHSKIGFQAAEAAVAQADAPKQPYNRNFPYFAHRIVAPRNLLYRRFRGKTQAVRPKLQIPP
jgi:CDGSH-type Zn-finger protein